MVEPGARVCPRCRAVAGQDRFCAECGLNLGAQAELPTREEWESQQRPLESGQPQGGEPSRQAEAPTQRLPAAAPSGRRRPSTPVLVAIAAVLLVAIGAGIYFGVVRDTDSGQSSEPAREPAAPQQPQATFVPSERELKNCLEGANWKVERSSGDSGIEGFAIAVATTPRPNARQLVNTQIIKDPEQARETEAELRAQWKKLGQSHTFTVDEVARGHTVVIDSLFPLDAAETQVLAGCIPGFTG